MTVKFLMITSSSEKWIYTKSGQLGARVHCTMSFKQEIPHASGTYFKQCQLKKINMFQLNIIQKIDQ